MWQIKQEVDKVFPVYYWPINREGI
jgi:hypothetical protein